MMNGWLPNCVDLRAFAPELALICTIAAVLLVPVFVGRRPYVAALVTIGGAFVALLCTAKYVPEVLQSGPIGAFTPGADGLPSSTPMLVADGLGSFFKVFITLLLVLITWLWIIGATGTGVIAAPSDSRSQTGGIGGDSAKAAPASGGAPDATAPRLRTGTPEFFVLLLTSALGMLLMVSTVNLLVILIAIETASLPSYAIVASDKRSRLGAEAALKYVTFGAASAAIMVYGMSLLYGRFGTLDISVMALQLARNNALADGVFWLGMAGVGAGILFKIAAVPMHLWCPDVFEGAPVEVTTWLSIASKAAGLGLLLRIVTALSGTPDLASLMTPLVWGVGIVAAVTCTVGNLAALRQDSVKRTLAYSSIAHAGYMMMAAAILAAPAGVREGILAPAGLPAGAGLASAVDAGAGGLPDFNAGMSAVIAYLFVYVTMNLGAFGATALVVWQTGTDHISAFTGLGRRSPFLAVPLAVCLFSLVGLPPLGGFAAKWYLLIALGRSAAAQPLLWALVVVAVVNTAISLYYYVRIIRQMFLTDDATQPAFTPAPGGLALVNLCAVALLLLGTLLFSPLGRYANNFATSVFAPPQSRARVEANSGGVRRPPIAPVLEARPGTVGDTADMRGL